MSESPQRILIVKPTALGDVIGALPVASLLKRRWPEATLDWLIARPFASLLETHPHVDGLVLFDRLRGESNMRQILSHRRLVKAVRAHRYDLVIDLQGLFRSGWITGRSGAMRRVGFGYAREGAAYFYNEPVAAREGHRNAAERYLDVAEHLGCGRDGEACITMTTDDEAAAERLLESIGGESFALLLPGTNWPTKRWPAEHFAALADRLDVSTVVAGASDAEEAAAIIPGLSLVNQTSVRELAAVMRRASLVVANDSGPMHLAAALGRPLVALFGPTDPRLTGPHEKAKSVLRLDVVCHPCFSRACVHGTCLHALSVEAVFQRCLAALQND